MDDNIIGNIAQLEHLDGNIAQVDDYLSGNISQLDYLSGNLNSNGDEQTIYRGYSAYEVALQQGFEGSKDEWLRALVGPQGKTGVSISDVRLNPDFTLTVTLDDGTEFTTDPIKGDKGDKGQKGDKGDKGDTGNGITFIRLNDDYSLTLFFSDGSYSNTTSVRGPQGEQGIQGIQGPKGDTGERGPQGQQGIQGVQGPKGQTGPQGQIGPQGPKGQKGDTGQRGPQGQIGPRGETGAAFTYEDFTPEQLELLRGPQGQKGQKGQTGQTGPQGLKGQTGQKGEKGDTGPQGPKGDQGQQGIQGIQGQVGPKGDTGPKGDIGQTGPEGKQGPQGPKGDKGDKGDPGQPGTNMEIHICSITEYDAETRMPTIVNPNSSTFYLVPAEDGTSPNLFTEWVYVNGAWELFGSVKIDLSGYLTDVQINGTSIVTDGVANIPIANSKEQVGGVVAKSPVWSGITFTASGAYLTLPANALIKAGTDNSRTSLIHQQHLSTFYGLAKAAGADEKDSTLPVGQYTDNAKDSIQNMLGITPLIASHETDPFESNHVVGELFIINGKLYRAKTALTAGEYVNEGTNVEVVSVAEVLDDKVGDVQINGTSIVNDGVANVPKATASTLGVAKVWNTYGVDMSGDGNLRIFGASSSEAKTGTHNYRPIVPSKQHESTFYGLAKASGDTTQSQSDNAVGTYTDEAKTAIKQMLDIHDTIDSFVEDVTGTDVTITGQPSYRYNCGELYSLTVTPPSSGTIDFRFTSGSTPTVLTLPQTVKMPEWWVEVEANTIYEMCITDGIYCGVMSWAM